MNHVESKPKDLETVKGWLAIARENNNKLAIQIIENLFPEILEVMDLRIKEAVIKIVHDTPRVELEDNYSVRKEEVIDWLEKQGEPKATKQIQWTGNNLKEVIDFTGKSVRFNEWFKSWDEYETYVHSHGDILKLFCIDGSHYEVPVGAWIIKTPDGYNIPSNFIFIPKSAELDKEDELMIQDAIHWIHEFQKSDRCKDENDMQNSVSCENWLKSFKPMNQADFIKKLVEIKTFIAKSRGFTRASREKVFEMIDSLKPSYHWKPSEEQMEALETAIRCREMPWEQLGTLYNDLKTL